MMTKHDAPKKKRNLLGKNIIAIIVIGFVLLVISIMNSGDREESTAEDVDESVPLEEVREQASNAILVNSEDVDAADIGIGIG